MKDLVDIYDPKLLNQLSDKYTLSSSLFADLSNKEKGKEEKIKLIKTLKENELEIVALLKQL